MKILLIEDDVSVAKAVIRALKDERFDVDHAQSGLIGLKMAATSKYDVILCDLLLPDKNGDEICRQLRSAGHTIPIIVLTALVDLESKVKMFGVGADDYLTKPFEFAELFARIKSALRKQKIEIGNVLVYEDLKLDLKKHQVERNGQRIDLRQKEIKILEYMIRHAEQVLTREMILSYVWGPTVERYTNVVDVHIHHLRNKIDKPFNKKFVKTVSSVGYKISK